MTRCDHCSRTPYHPEPQTQLCHPAGYALDCYALVTWASHPTPCKYCRTVRDTQEAGRQATLFIQTLRKAQQ